MMSPLSEAFYRLNTFHTYADNRHKVRAEKTRLHPCSLQPCAGLLQPRRRPGHTAYSGLLQGATRRTFKRVCTQAAVILRLRGAERNKSAGSGSRAEHLPVGQQETGHLPPGLEFPGPASPLSLLDAEVEGSLPS